MLFTKEELHNIILQHNIHITGVLHVGAHDCEELEMYNSIDIDNIIWIDAIADKVTECKARGITNIYEAVITDTDDADVTFNIANNIQSSSVLEFGTHAKEHPCVKFVKTVNKKSITIDSFFLSKKIDPFPYNFWNFDIQGAELMALNGSTKSIENVKIIYLEVNVKELYINCPLINDIDVFLAKYNFTRVAQRITIHGWGDAIYIRS